MADLIWVWRGRVRIDALANALRSFRQFGCLLNREPLAAYRSIQVGWAPWQCVGEGGEVDHLKAL